MTATAQPGPSPFKVDVAVKLVPKFSEQDVESFFLAFEKVAQLNRFPEDQYGAVLQAHLTGKAQRVFAELTLDECRDYPTLKAAILNAYAVVPEVYRKRFRGLTRNQSETHSEFAFRLSTQFRRWLESENTYDDLEHLRELYLMEQFNTTLDSDLRMWLLDQKPTTLTAAAKFADQYVAVRKASHTDKAHGWKPKSLQGNTGVKPPVPVSRPSVHSSSSTADAKPADSSTKPTSRDPFRSKVICFYCKRPGHTISDCRRRMAKAVTESSGTPVQLVSTLERPVAAADVNRSLKLPASTDIDPLFAQHCAEMVLVRPDQSTRSILALRDTGALQSLISSQELSDTDYTSTGEFRLIRGVTGDVVSVPLVQVSLKSTLCTGTYLCGLVAALPPGIAVLVGNDLCPDTPIPSVNVVTRSQAAQYRATELPVDPVSSSPTTECQFSPCGDDTSADLSLLFSDHLLQDVSRSELIRLQQLDRDLTSVFELVDKPNHCYTLRSGVLVRRWKDELSPQEAEYHQIVVPTMLRPQLLQLAHDIPAAGHLGIAKTKSRLIRHFYWPSIMKDVKDYCRSCDVCQRLGKGSSRAPAPLHNLPLVTEPFCQVAIDIVGPLPVCKDTGNRFILTVLDLCTHYPDAVPLPRHTASDVEQGLTSVFSRFGLPQEILSDQASDFMSELMQNFLHDLGVNHIRASPYHPQTNGACERFNGTMKTMLRALVDQFPDSWDRALPWVLFAYREVPVETLGCSPFDLLFGRSAVGPLSLMKNTWLQEADLGSAKQNVVEFILNTRERLRHAV